MESFTRLARVYWDIENTHDARDVTYLPEAVPFFATFLRNFLRCRWIIMERQSRVYMRPLKVHLPDWQQRMAEIFAANGFKAIWTPGAAESRMVGDIYTAIEQAQDTRIGGTYPLPELVIIISGDRDVLEAVRTLQQTGREVWVMAKHDRLHKPLRCIAHHAFILERIFPGLRYCSYEPL